MGVEVEDKNFWEQEYERFLRLFPLEEDEIVVEFFSHFLNASSEEFFYYFEDLLDGRGWNFEGTIGCNFNLERQQNFAIQGVLFYRDLTLGDPDNYPKDYLETLVPYHTFLDMMRAIAQWRLKIFPEDEVEIRRTFSNQSLDFSLSNLGKGNGDSGKIWWKKCQARYPISQRANLRSETFKLKFGL